MTINPNQVLKDFEGKDIVVEEKPFTLKTVVVTALLFQDKDLVSTPEQSMRAYELGVEITNKDSVELTAEDVVFIKTRLHKSYSALVYGQVVTILEGKLRL